MSDAKEFLSVKWQLMQPLVHRTLTGLKKNLSLSRMHTLHSRFPTTLWCSKKIFPTLHGRFPAVQV